LLEHGRHRSYHGVFGVGFVGEVAFAGMQHTGRKRFIKSALRIQLAVQRAMNVCVPSFH